MSLDFGKRIKGREQLIKLSLDSDTIAKKIIDVFQILNKKNSIK